MFWGQVGIGAALAWRRLYAPRPEKKKRKKPCPQRTEMITCGSSRHDHGDVVPPEARHFPAEISHARRRRSFLGRRSACVFGSALELTCWSADIAADRLETVVGVVVVG